MTEELDLKQIEKNAYTSYHQDGLIDIIIGISLLFFTICMLTELFWMGGIIVPILLPIYIGAKQKFTIPRIGYVKFGPKGKTRGFLVIGIIMAVAFLGLIVGMFALVPNIRDSVIPFLVAYYNLIIAGIGAALTLMMAISAGIKRFYIYSAAILVVFSVAQIFNINLLYSTITISLLFLVLGVMTLVQFIQKNPVDAEEMANAPLREVGE